jgi:hypothetical protein
MTLDSTHSNRPTTDDPDPAPSRLAMLHERLEELAEDMHDMAGRVIANGGEPNYASEKLGRAVHEGIQALAAIDLLFIERFIPDSDPGAATEFAVGVRADELARETARVYVAEREWLS